MLSLVVKLIRLSTVPSRAAPRQSSVKQSMSFPYRLAFTFAFLGLVGAAWGEPIQSSSGQQTVSLGGSQRLVLTYRPSRCRTPSLLFVFHGLGGAQSYRKSASILADKTCMIVVAPQFETRTETYQLGGIVRKGVIQDPSEWKIDIVSHVVDWARKETGVSNYYLLGHSAGAQFLSRVAAFLPTQALRIVIANPSTHVLPSLVVGAPFGFGGLFSSETAEAHLRSYLQQPVTIYLGEADIGEDDDDLNLTAPAMAQGKTRFERGMNAFNAGKALAADRSWSFNWRLVRAPGVGHSARAMFSAPQAVDALRP
jgi:pimeloyl-ACP methyl ester carboxylesterase